MSICFTKIVIMMIIRDKNTGAVIMAKKENKEIYSDLRKSILDENGKTLGVNKLADKLHIAAPRISELENGKRDMSLTELKAYHSFFGVSYEYLLGESSVELLKPNLMATCSYTGLSKYAINNITSNNSQYVEAVEDFLSSPLFVEIINKIIQCSKLNNMDTKNFLDFLSYEPYEDTALGDKDGLKNSIEKLIDEKVNLINFEVSKLFNKYIETLSSAVEQNIIEYVDELYTQDVDYCSLSDLVQNLKYDSDNNRKIDYIPSKISEQEKLISIKNDYEKIINENKLMCDKFQKYVDTKEFEKRIADLNKRISEISEKLNKEDSDTAQHNPKNE